MIDLFFAHFVGCKQVLQVEIRESAVGHPCRQKLSQPAGVHCAQFANFLEYHPVQRVIENARVQQLADLRARPALNQHGTEKAQRVFLKLESGVAITNTHKAALNSASKMKNSHPMR